MTRSGGVRPRARTISGGLALPLRQLPPDAPRTVALDTPDALTKIVAGIAVALIDVFDSVRRGAAERGIS